MRTIHKYEILGAVTRVPMPRGAEVLSVANQRERIYVWALVETGMDDVDRAFRLVGTGHECTDVDGKFIGTVLMHGGDYVFHVFDHGEMT